MLLEEEGGRTKATTRMLFATPEARSMAVGTGMQRGMRECMRQIDELLATVGARGANR